MKFDQAIIRYLGRLMERKFEIENKIIDDFGVFTPQQELELNWISQRLELIREVQLMRWKKNRALN